MSALTKIAPPHLLRAAHRRLRSREICHALKLAGFRDVSRIPTFTHRDELESLYQLAQNSVRGARVLEIGSYLGASTCYIAAGLSGNAGTITCIDTWQNQTMPEGELDTFAKFRANTAAADHIITTMRKDSASVAAAELQGPFDLVFLDGDHSYNHTRMDFLLVAPLVSGTGVIAFHDSHFFEGVSRVIGEALASGQWQLGGVVRNLAWLCKAHFSNRS